MKIVPKKRKKGIVWHLDMRDADGRRIIKSLKTDDYQEAQKRGFEKASKIMAGQSPEFRSKVTLGDLIDRVLPHVQASLAKKTYQLYEAAFSSFLSVCDRGARLTTISRNLVDTWRIQARAKLKPSSVNNYAMRLHTAFEMATEWGLFEGKNPFAKLKRLTVVKKAGREKYFMFDELQKILQEISTRRNGSTYRVGAMIALYAGLRIEEVVRIRKTDIQEGRLHVIKTKANAPRAIPLPEEVLSAISPLLESDKSEWLFPSPFHPKEHLSTGCLRQIFRESCRKIGHTIGHFHMLRHTFSAVNLSLGADVYSVAHFLGHASVQTTEREYGHLIPGSRDHLIHVSADHISKGLSQAENLSRNLSTIPPVVVVSRPEVTQ